MYTYKRPYTHTHTHTYTHIHIYDRSSTVEELARDFICAAGNSPKLACNSGSNRYAKGSVGCMMFKSFVPPGNAKLLPVKLAVKSN